MKVLLHPLPFIMGLIVLLSTQTFIPLPPALVWLLLFLASLGTPLAAYIKPLYSRATIRVSQQSEHLLTTILTVVSIALGLLAVALKTAPFVVAPMAYGAIALLIAIIGIAVNQLEVDGGEPGPSGKVYATVTSGSSSAQGTPAQPASSASLPPKAA
ncbi:MAG: hypothetical protein KGL39_31595 [Patescibacteria group bacterium]|nr:hypothetical protein [Patescibacteria group bacterium]